MAHHSAKLVIKASVARWGTLTQGSVCSSPANSAMYSYATPGLISSLTHPAVPPGVQEVICGEPRQSAKLQDIHKQGG
jgi:hypothetical protein